MQVDFRRWVVPLGHQVLLTDVTWDELETILEEWGEERATRLSYSNGTLEIMSPSPEHEDTKVILADLIKIILEEQGREFRNLGSTTFKSEPMDQAVEPDECFYIEHEPAIRGKKRIDLTTDPPPDLVLEIDLTARTRFHNHARLGVPELWRYDGHTLEISVLRHGQYVLSSQSRHFPDIPVTDALPHHLAQSRSVGRTAVMRTFRAWVGERLG
jgi:Uma2 family endonuclease